MPVNIPLSVIKEAIARHETIGEKKYKSPDNHKLTTKGGFSVDKADDGGYDMIQVTKEDTGWVATVYNQFPDEDGFSKTEGYFIDVKNSKDLKQVAKEVNLLLGSEFKV